MTTYRSAFLRMKQVRRWSIFLAFGVTAFFHAEDTMAVPTVITNVMIDKGEYNYPEQELSQGTVSCEVDASYPKISGVAGAKAINASIRKIQNMHTYRCNSQRAIVNLIHQITYNDKNLLSITFGDEIRNQGGQGSCHGSSDQRTFDTSTGKRILLRNIIFHSKIEALQQYMADYLYKNEAPSDSNAQDRERMKKQIAAATAIDINSKGYDDNVFIDSGQLIYSINGYIFSCAAGTFHPIPIPKEFISDPRILAAIK